MAIDESTHEIVVCTLQDTVLIEECERQIKAMCDTGGRAFTMSVPVNHNRDTDMIFTELIRRLKYYASFYDMAKQWIKLEEEIEKLYFDEDGNVKEFEVELCDVGEVAAKAFGYQ